MVIHEAKRMYSVPVTLNALLQEEIKAEPVIICKEDVLLRIPTKNDMVIRARVVNSVLAGHP